VPRQRIRSRLKIPVVRKRRGMVAISTDYVLFSEDHAGSAAHP
jgi:hypothetical protein